MAGVLVEGEPRVHSMSKISKISGVDFKSALRTWRASICQGGTWRTLLGHFWHKMPKIHSCGLQYSKYSVEACSLIPLAKSSPYKRSIDLSVALGRPWRAWGLHGMHPGGEHVACVETSGVYIYFKTSLIIHEDKTKEIQLLVSKCRWQVSWFYIRWQCLQLHTPIAVDYTKGRDTPDAKP